MRRFTCPNCGARTFFPDARCLSCEASLGYTLPADDMELASARHRCGAAEIHGCNWLVAEAGSWCESCGLDVDPAAHPGVVEVAVFHQAMRRVRRQFQLAGLDPVSAAPPLRFRLERPTADHPVTIGHEDGLVTLDVSEADPVVREKSRTSLGEPYRTPLGHVRHETGHWHWQAFVEHDDQRLSSFRELFGDERADYAEALKAHYGKPDDGSWRDSYLSHYAAAHPWEDYAESFAHVLHMGDTLETARHEGIISDADGPFDQLYPRWVDVTVALNELSRSMGVPDPYPFAPSPASVSKLHFVHDLLATAPPAANVI